MNITEWLCAMLIFTITMMILSNTFGSFLKTTERVSKALIGAAASCQIQMLWEGDIHFRRVSPVARSSSSNGRRHIVAFWTRTDEGLKYTVYHFMLDEKGAVAALDRYSVDQSELLLESQQHVRLFVERTSQGIYQHPYGRLTNPMPLADLVPLASLRGVDEMLCFDTGYYRYYLP